MLVIGDQRFVPVQGEVRTAGSFDLGNQKQHAITFAVDHDDDLRGVAASVELNWLGNVVWTNVEKISGDHSKFSIQAQTGGEATLLVPFDDRHEVLVDGKSQELRGSTSGFTLFDLTEGAHVIEVNYRDPWHLSTMILLSLIVAAATATAIVFVSLKSELHLGRKKLA